MRVHLLFVLFGAYFLGYRGAEAVQCFVCNSHNDSRCAQEKPPRNMTQDCAEHVEGSKYTMCRKIVQVVEFTVNGMPPNTRVIRSCGWDDSNYKGKCYQRSGFGGRQEVCSCTTDFCNAATPGVHVPRGLLVFIFILSAVLTFVRY